MSSEGLHHLSASKLNIAEKCLWWAGPSVTLDPRTTSAAAALGLAMHDIVEWEAKNLTVVPDDVIQSTCEKRGLTKSQRDDLDAMIMHWHQWWFLFRDSRAGEWKSELPVAYDVSSNRARVLPTNGQRDYSAMKPTEVPGTIDLCVVDEFGALVLDVKTGYAKHSVSEHVLQLSHNALCLARIHDLDEVTIAVAHITTNGVFFTKRVLDTFDLDVMNMTLLGWVRKLDETDPVPGSHCRWCPAKATCPITLRVTTDAAIAAKANLPSVGGPIDEHNAKLVLTSLFRIEAWIAERKKALEAYAETNPIALDDGKVWARVEKPGKEKFDLEVPNALASLRNALGEHADAALDVTTTKAGIERAVRKALSQERNHARGAQKQRVQAVLDVMRDVGALKRSAPTVVFEATEPKAQTDATNNTEETE